jgi:hypothetical protein
MEQKMVAVLLRKMLNYLIYGKIKNVQISI